MSKKGFIQHDVENKQLKVENNKEKQKRQKKQKLKMIKKIKKKKHT